MIKRPRWLAEIRAALKRSRVTALVGPRQSGKTTLARQILTPDSPAYFDLEDPRSLARLAEPMTALAPLRGVVIIDEIQRRPDLFPILRVLADRRPLRARFLILGSADPDLLRQSSETLAGRMETINLSGFGLQRAGRACASKALETGRISPSVPCALGEGELCLAPAVHPDLSRTRLASAWHHHSCCHRAQILDDARPLPWGYLERG